MNSIEIGSILTPQIAAERGLQRLQERTSHSIQITLYRETRLRSGDVWIVTVNHIVSTMTTLERVGQYALLHS